MKTASAINSFSPRKGTELVFDSIHSPSDSFHLIDSFFLQGWKKGQPPNVIDCVNEIIDYTLEVSKLPAAS
jgi:hypothetical protein